MYDAIVIGAGPSGMMAAIIAAKHKKKVLLLDKNNVVGKKLKLTGGGRCNITNYKDTKDFIKSLPLKNGRFLYSALTNFNPYDIYQYMESLGVPLKVERDSKVFPKSNRSGDIIEAFQKELNRYHVDIKLNTEVTDLEIEDEIKRIHTTKATYLAKHVVISTGGKSYPHTGSTGLGHTLAEKIGHKITKLFPTESPILSSDPIITSKELQGLSFSDIKLSLVDENKKTIKYHIHDLIFTHFGLSGPAALKLSQFVVDYLETHKQATLELDLFPSQSYEQIVDQIKGLKKASPNKTIKNTLTQFSQNRYIAFLLNQIELDENMTLSHLSNKKINQFVSGLKHFTIIVHGVKPISNAFVTGGGISLKEVNPKTMESKLVNGLYFTGEVLDLHGYTGGYNITIALSTGYTAGLTIGLN